MIPNVKTQAFMLFTSVLTFSQKVFRFIHFDQLHQYFNNFIDLGQEYFSFRLYFFLMADIHGIICVTIKNGIAVRYVSIFAKTYRTLFFVMVRVRHVTLQKLN